MFSQQRKLFDYGFSFIEKWECIFDHITMIGVNITNSTILDITFVTKFLITTCILNSLTNIVFEYLRNNN